MKLTCERQKTELERIVTATDEFFAAEGISDNIRYAVDLVTEELFVNLVNYNTGTNAKIDLEFSAAEGGIRVSITDYDVDRFDPTVHGNVDVKAPLKERSPGGLGIYLVLRLVDSIQYDYRNRVSKITFTKTTESEKDVLY
jgi:serine/threonine-protein kinase RsbW